MFLILSEQACPDTRLFAVATFEPKNSVLEPKTRQVRRVYFSSVCMSKLGYLNFHQLYVERVGFNQF